MPPPGLAHNGAPGTPPPGPHPAQPGFPPPGLAHNGAPGMPPPGLTPNGAPHVPPHGSAPHGSASHSPPNGRPPNGAPGGPTLVDQPLRSPAPPVTSIRVSPVPPDGFGQSMWFSGSRPNPPAPPPAPLPPPPMVPPLTPSPTGSAEAVLNTYPLKQWKAQNPVVEDMPTISWLDED